MRHIENYQCIPELRKSEKLNNYSEKFAEDSILETPKSPPIPTGLDKGQDIHGSCDLSSDNLLSKTQHTQYEKENTLRSSARSLS